MPPGFSVRGVGLVEVELEDAGVAADRQAARGPGEHHQADAVAAAVGLVEEALQLGREPLAARRVDVAREHRLAVVDGEHDVEAGGGDDGGLAAVLHAQETVRTAA